MIICRICSKWDDNNKIMEAQIVVWFFFIPSILLCLKGIKFRDEWNKGYYYFGLVLSGCILSERVELFGYLIILPICYYLI